MTTILYTPSTNHHQGYLELISFHASLMTSRRCQLQNNQMNVKMMTAQRMIKGRQLLFTPKSTKFYGRQLIRVRIILHSEAKRDASCRVSTPRQEMTPLNGRSSSRSRHRCVRGTNWTYAGLPGDGWENSIIDEWKLVGYLSASI